MSDGASAGVLGDSLELPSVLAFLSRFTAAGHHQRSVYSLPLYFPLLSVPILWVRKFFGFWSV